MTVYRQLGSSIPGSHHAFLSLQSSGIETLVEELCSRLKDLQSQQGESTAPAGRPRPHAGRRPQNRPERKSTELESSCSACRQAGVLPRLCLWVAAGQPMAILCREVPCSQSDFICRSTPREEMKLWIWSSHLLSLPSSLLLPTIPN